MQWEYTFLCLSFMEVASAYYVQYILPIGGVDMCPPYVIIALTLISPLLYRGYKERKACC